MHNAYLRRISVAKEWHRTEPLKLALERLNTVSCKTQCDRLPKEIGRIYKIAKRNHLTGQDSMVRPNKARLEEKCVTSLLCPLLES